MTAAGRDAIFISHANPEDNAFTVWLGARLTGLATRCGPTCSDCVAGRIGNVGWKVACATKHSRSCPLARQKESISKAGGMRFR